MCYKDEDERLWQEDPYEYIRMKFSQCAYFVRNLFSTVLFYGARKDHVLNTIYCLCFFSSYILNLNTLCH